MKELVEICHKIAVEKGFWDLTCSICGHNYKIHLQGKCPCCMSTKEASFERNDGEIIALMHSELSEALEELRKKSCDMNKVGEELADCVIRIMDYCGARNIDLEKLLLDKIEINKTRPHKHGKAF
jgi:NTP pyrophosphatase (non-canonical NTP hydrolase)